MSQKKYVLDLLTETGKLGVEPCSTLVISNHQLIQDRMVFKILNDIGDQLGNLTISQ